MATVEVSYVDRDHLHARVRDHQLDIDQPVDAGGDDCGPTPTELFVTSLAGCVAHYAQRFLGRHGVDPAGLTVTAEWALATDRPARVGRITLVVRPPDGLPAGRRDALLAVASHCTVHNTIARPPRVSVELVISDVAAVA